MRLLFIALIFISCTSDNESAATKGNVIYLNLNAEPAVLNPITNKDTFSTEVHSYMQDALLSRDPDTLEWLPGLAESYVVSDDGMVYTFSLNKSAKFHDGKPVTAEDVKFSFDVNFMDEYAALNLRPYFEKFASPKIIDSHTIEFTAKEKYHLNMDVVSGLLKILPKHIYNDPEKGKKINKTAHASGPYKMGVWDQGKRIVLEKNKDWHGFAYEHNKKRYNFDRIVFRFVKETTTALEMLKKGDIDFLDLSGKPEAYVVNAVGDKWGDVVEKHKVEQLTPKPYIFIAFNLNNEMFKDVRLRKALTHLANRELIAEKFYYNMWEVMTGPTYRHSIYADQSVEPIDFDPEAALRLLRQAGWSDSDKDGTLDKIVKGKKTNLSFTLTTASKERMKVFTVFKEDAKKVGVDVKLQLIEWNSFVKLLEERKFETVALGWGNGMLNWDPKQIWHSASAKKGGSNFVGYKNPEVDRLIDEARGILDIEKRKKVLHEVYRLIAADVPYIFLLNQKNTLYANTKRIKKQKPAFKYSIGIDTWSAE